VRAALASAQLQQAASTGAAAPQGVAQAMLAFREERRAFDAITLRDAGEIAAPTEAELRARLYQTPEAFATPETRSVTWLHIDPAAVAAPVSDADLRVVYRRHNGLAGKVSRLEIGAVAAGPRIELHEGNRGTQDTVCMITAAPALGIDFTRGGGGCANDKARSLTLHAVPAGTLLLLFDSPTGNREDDWVAIEVKRAITRKTIDSFERTFEDADVRVVYLRNNGLDGKLSRLEFTSAAALQGVISFHEGNDGRQNKVCDLTPTAQIVRFKSHAACDNDEARSVVLTQLAPGTRIDIFDNPDCRTNDDWTSIDVRRPVFRKTIGSFQRTFQDDDVTVAYHRENGLDGKVSCVRIQR